MKAIVQAKYGSPDGLELHEVATPAVGDDDVLVRVRAASVHPDVWHVVTGRPLVLRLMGNGFSKPRHPIPGTDFAGIVEAVGRNVTRFRLGDAVFGATGRHEWMNGGAFAEYVAVRQDMLALKPASITFEQAASVPTSGFIALLNLRGGTLIRPGQKVLVNGAAGGVGSLALQIAKARGAQVTAVDRPNKLGLLRALGADHAVDCTREDFTGSGARYDFIFDVPGNRSLAACRRALEPEGRYVLIGHEQFGASRKRVLGLLPRFLGLVLLSFVVKELRLGRASIPTRQEAVATLRELLDAGKITPIIDRTYPLARTREALRRMVAGDANGKLIIVP
jgi:NADPH:quinone reductase-like Zn-dependent oxidoreductase